MTLPKAKGYEMGTVTLHELIAHDVVRITSSNFPAGQFTRIPRGHHAYKISKEADCEIIQAFLLKDMPPEFDVTTLKKIVF